MMVLIDIDGVCLDTAAAIEEWQNRWALSPLWCRTTYSIPPNVRRETFDRESFWAGLKPVEGAYEGVERLLEAGHEVVFVTAPYPTSGWFAIRTKLMAKFFGDLFFGDVPIIFCPAELKKEIRGGYLIEDNLKTAVDWENDQHPLRATSIVLRSTYTDSFEGYPAEHQWVEETWKDIADAILGEN